MLGIMNNVPFDGGAADLYATPKKADEQPVFEKVNKKPKVNYLKDGRKLIDGKIQEIHESNTLWGDLLKRSVTRKLHAEADSKSNEEKTVVKEDAKKQAILISENGSHIEAAQH